MQNELQALAGKIGELESDADEHGYVASDLIRSEALTIDLGFVT